MNIVIKLKNIEYEIDILNGQDISIPINFKKKIGPRFYDEKYPSVSYYKSTDNEYDLEKGSGCNVPIINLNIHCSGTHTESANHIIKKSRTVNKLSIPHFIPCQLISINPEYDTMESYHVKIEKDDLLITKNKLMKLINVDCDSFNKGLIIRTLPNMKSKCEQNYDQLNHAYFTNDAIKFIKKIGFNHIIVDTPSIDRYDDNGKLGNHHLFFNNSHENTITELTYIDNNIIDGKYFLCLNISNFELDAAPSRPIIYSIL